MTIASCWCIDYTCMVISHIDGVLGWDCGAGAVPTAGDYIVDTTGCKFIVFKLLVDFCGVAGTDAVTDVVTTCTTTKIAVNDCLVGLDQVNFDAVVLLACDQRKTSKDRPDRRRKPNL